MKNFCLTLIVLVLTGCAHQSGYKAFYHPHFDAKAVAEEQELEILAAGEEPVIYRSDDLRRDVYILRSKKYWPVGYSSFNGPSEDSDNALEQAKRVGATVVLVSSEFTNAQQVTSTLILPDNQTTYHSGTVTANSSYSNSYGAGIGSSSTYGSYNGTSTTYGTKAVPITRTHYRYDQTAVYFVKWNGKIRYGLSMKNLEPAESAALRRNTGAVVEVVFENTPAFFANILPGDVVIAVDGTAVKNVEHATQLLAQTPADATTSSLLVLRNGVESSFELRL